MDYVQLKKVTGKGLLSKFVNFPLSLYKGNDYYVPPLHSEEVDIWSPKKNPALEYSDAELFLAIKNGNVVGRVALIINHKEEKIQGARKLRFGWLDFIDDDLVSQALIKHVIQFGKETGCKKIEGPMGFTNLDKAGMLTMGFDKCATMIGLYNLDYYPKHMEKMGLRREKEWIEYEIEFPEKLPEKIEKFSQLIVEKYNLKVLKFKKKKEIIPLVEPIFKLLDETYKDLSTYTPITDDQIKHYKEKYFGFIDKDYISCIEDKNGNLIAFSIVMPSYSKALQKAGGKIFPFGWWHLLQASKKNDRACFYLIGIDPHYRGKGIKSVIFMEIYNSLKKKGIKYLETNPELIENKNIQLLWKDYNPVLHKRRNTYSLDI